MEFRILGPLEVDGDDGSRLELAGQKPRGLLALLLLHPNEVVSTDALIEELWAGRPPETAANTLQVYVSQLRKVLSPGAVVRQAPGYLLRVEPDSVDAARFEQLAQQGRRALEAGSHEQAARTLRVALELLRGPPLADFTFDSFAQAEIARLTELRMATLEERIEADLALGRHDVLVGELEALIAENPLRERLRGQLMLALYRSGRQAEALEAYRRTRRELLEELGLEPSTGLQELERAILQQDPSLEAPVRAPAEAALRVAPRTVRKTVTVLCLDLTAPEGTLDPEVATRLASAAFEVVDRALGRHHGVVQVRSGGRTTAVFGTPTAHEDDALRAARAALELRAPSGIELLPRLELRAGIEAGAVLAEEGPDAPGVIAGAAIDGATRLAQAAQPGTILVGEGAEPLLRLSARLDPVQAAEARRSQDLPAWRLVELTSDLPIPRRLDAPLVGREDELGALVEAFEETARTREPRLFTLLGPPGIGKSRLAAELRTAIADRARVLGGRCLPYGDGITFWPLKEAVDQLREENNGQTMAGLLAGEEDAELVAERVAGLVGTAESRAGGSEETFWAVRRLFETLGRERPLVVVFDDCHWAEPTFLDLVEYTLESARETSLLLVALARPELLEDRPAWAGGKLKPDSLLLEPLSESDCDALIRNLLGQAPLEENLRERISGAAEGNPLFIEQMLAMLSEEDGEAELRVPPTIQALLAARLDRLPAAERDLLGAASVVGKEFWRDAVAELSAEADRSGVPDRLHSLELKHLIAPAKSIFPGDEAFRFRHQLIRDAAYEAMPKAQRADLHERFADWLERIAPKRIREFEEILGYHLERAYRYQSELGLPAEQAGNLAARAGERLASAGRRAYALGDVPGAVNLLARAASLLPDEQSARLELLTDLGEALREVGDLDWSASVLDEAITLSANAGERALEWRARLAQLRLRSSIEPIATTEEQRRLADEAVQVFTELEDDRGLAKAWAAVARAVWIRSQAAEAEEALRSAIDYAKRAGDYATYARAVHLYLGAGAFGPTPAPEAIRRCEEVLARAEEPLRIKASALRPLALLKAMQGEFDEARRLVERDRALLEDLGLRLLAASAVEGYGLVELLAGDPAAAEREFRSGLDVLEEIGDRSAICSIAALLGRAAYENGRLAEALRATELSEETAAADDMAAQVQWRGPRAKVFACRGRVKKAEELAREGVALAQQTDFPILQGDALFDLAEVLRLRGRADEAATTLGEAARLYALKGNVVSAERAKVLARALTRDTKKRARGAAA